MLILRKTCKHFNSTSRGSSCVMKFLWWLRRWGFLRWTKDFDEGKVTFVGDKNLKLKLTVFSDLNLKIEFFWGYEDLWVSKVLMKFCSLKPQQWHPPCSYLKCILPFQNIKDWKPSVSETRRLNIHTNFSLKTTEKIWKKTKENIQPPNAITLKIHVCFIHLRVYRNNKQRRTRSTGGLRDPKTRWLNERAPVDF